MTDKHMLQEIRENNTNLMRIATIIFSLGTLFLIVSETFFATKRQPVLLTGVVVFALVFLIFLPYLLRKIHSNEQMLMHVVSFEITLISLSLPFLFSSSPVMWALGLLPILVSATILSPTIMYYTFILVALTETILFKLVQANVMTFENFTDRITILVLCMFFAFMINKQYRKSLLKSHKQLLEIEEKTNQNDGLIKNVRNVIHELSSLTVAEMSERTTRESSELAVTISEIAKANYEQSTDTEQASTQVTAFGKKLENASGAIETTVVLCDDAARLNESGLKTVKALLEKTTIVKQSASEVNDIIHLVEESSKEIGGIVASISAVAAQTNLLALNASIESARAGEAGKGFAVVADEIKKLAGQTSTSTEEIIKIVQDIQRSADHAVSKMDVASVKVNEQSEAVSETEKTFNQITEAIQGLLESIRSVELENKEMLVGKDLIVDSLQNISASAEENSASVEEISASSENILSSMQTLKKQADRLAELSDSLKQELRIA